MHRLARDANDACKLICCSTSERIKKFQRGMPALFAVVVNWTTSIITGTASYTNRLQVFLASMAQNESVDILSLINSLTHVHLDRQVY